MKILRVFPFRTSKRGVINKESLAILQDVLEGLKRICNHCADNDCENCWSNEICERIIKLFAKKE